MNHESSSNSVGARFPWRLWAILVAAILVTTVLVVPYSLALQGMSLKLTPALALNLVLGTAPYALLAALGLLIARRIGLGLPFLESWLAGRPDWGRVRTFLLPAILSGAAAGVIIVGLDAMLFAPRMPQLAQLGQPPAWAGLLASFYGGVTEEILLRLFLLSLFAWIGRRVSRTPAGRPGLGALWVANVLAALLFGLGHLPAVAAAGVPLDALVVTRSLVLNGVGGLVFGWLYWRYGLEAAMVSHFSADLVLHVLVPLLAAG